MSSRAVQRKRKRQMKLGKKITLESMQLPSIPSRGKRADDSESSPDEEDDEDDSVPDNHEYIKKSVKKAKVTKESDYSEIFDINRGVEYREYLQLSINEILNLSDGEQLTTYDKAHLVLEAILYPIQRDFFYQLYFGENPAYSNYTPTTTAASSSSFSKKLSHRFSTIFSMKDFKKLIKENIFLIEEEIQISKNLKKYIETNNEIITIGGHKLSKAITDLDNPCAITLFEPQKIHQILWKLLSCLEFEFDCRIFAHIVYHALGYEIKKSEEEEEEMKYESVAYDQFIIQLEGTSTWIVSPSAASSSSTSTVTTTSTATIKNSHYHLVEGDVLYIPKYRSYTLFSSSASTNTNTTANTADSTTISKPPAASLYMILGYNESRSMSDLMQLVIPQAINNLSIESKLFQQTLPLSLKDYMGVAASEPTSSSSSAPNTIEKNEALIVKNINQSMILEHHRTLFQQYITHQIVPLLSHQIIDILDPAVDQLHKNFLLQRLPIPLSDNEEAVTSAGMTTVTIYPYTLLRMIRPKIAIAVIEEGKMVVYHCMDNAR
jgi:hypothetical protein